MADEEFLEKLRAAEARVCELVDAQFDLSMRVEDEFHVLEATLALELAQLEGRAADADQLPAARAALDSALLRCASLEAAHAPVVDAAAERLRVLHERTLASEGARHQLEQLARSQAAEVDALTDALSESRAQETAAQSGRIEAQGALEDATLRIADLERIVTRLRADARELSAAHSAAAARASAHERALLGMLCECDEEVGASRRIQQSPGILRAILAELVQTQVAVCSLAEAGREFFATSDERSFLKALAQVEARVDEAVATTRHLLRLNTHSRAHALAFARVPRPEPPALELVSPRVARQRLSVPTQQLRLGGMARGAATERGTVRGGYAALAAPPSVHPPPAPPALAPTLVGAAGPKRGGFAPPPAGLLSYPATPSARLLPGARLGTASLSLSRGESLG